MKHSELVLLREEEGENYHLVTEKSTQGQKLGMFQIFILTLRFNVPVCTEWPFSGLQGKQLILIRGVLGAGESPGHSHAHQALALLGTSAEQG